MTDKDYEIQLKGIDCCQNCVRFSLGVHVTGCEAGWCYKGKWTLQYRKDICDEYIRRADNG